MDLRSEEYEESAEFARFEKEVTGFAPEAVVTLDAADEARLVGEVPGRRVVMAGAGVVFLVGCAVVVARVVLG
ncbi:MULTISPECIES: hypothetical protein [Streptomyces]|uniref:Uncharacterized protein n=1 Tax=Streptomyces typhae TaxID=2681492 RepID=A0A6L6WT61_9ACTN|nr:MULTISPECIES: hypothetical protein [Streptomyces]MVO83566.1 hypothetical protein [Streptomyces typhae]